jgi:hypothetical protein
MDLSNQKIRVAFIFEAIGRPPEYLTEALESITKSIGNEKGVKVLNSKINPPVEMKNQKDFFTSFSEVEVEIEQAIQIAIMMFKYMPAHVEIIHPEKMMITNSEMSDIFSELTRRLHGYEELARIMQNEKMILETKLREFLPKEKSGSEQVQTSPAKEAGQKKAKKKK